MDLGTVAHALTLNAGKEFVVLEYDDFRTNAAKEARDTVRAAGFVPILRDDFDRATKVTDALKAQMHVRGIALDGRSEVAITWQEDGLSGPVMCRGMLDHLRLEAGTIYDLKFVSNAAQHSIERSAENFGYAIQSAAYTRAVTGLRPDLAGRIQFVFLFCEVEPPYALNVCRPSGMFSELGERRWLRAVDVWGRCLKNDSWPGYGDEVNDIFPPGWALASEGLR
jgi:hypothetical protein